ncbi:MAG: L-threonylcarbamoyladenylate synthase [Tidjanibacter sp.]|nr:L-threonylcarbamoyladenylate synthase [Tidjanibacter sp.]
MAELVKIYEQNPNEREIERIVKVLENDGVVIYPTDGVYAFGCSLHSVKAIDRIKQIRCKRDDELTIVCSSFGMIDRFAKVDNSCFKVLKRNLPGRFTFILEASSRVPDKALGRRKKVGIRMPDNAIPLAIVESLDFPMATASVKDDDQVIEYTTDPELIKERYDRQVDIVIDGGTGDNVPTTMVDLTDGEAVVVREGGGELK